jgi:pyridoxamine 5'-phosphate oxidase
MTDPKSLRNPYGNTGFEREDLADNPVETFNRWWAEILQTDTIEPNAMALATSTPDGHPSLRMVLLKGYSQEGFEFYTNYHSRKGSELSQNPNVALLFFWEKLERQVRIEGRAEKLPHEKSLAYFQSRPRGSQLGAWVSPQSRVIADRQELEENYRKLEERFAGDELLPLPENWGGFLVRPNRFEFWQGRADRLHDRFVYRFENGRWIIERLAP